MRVENWITPRNMIVMEIVEDRGESFLKILDYTKKKNKTEMEEITLARW